MMPSSHAGASSRLSARNFQSLAQLVEQHAGIRLNATKQMMVEGRLRRRVQALGLPGLDAYAAHVLDAACPDQELTGLIDCITTNKTDFFREPSHFVFLQDEAIPLLLQAQARRPARIKVWSAACSIGAEAYSIAMVLHDMQERRPGFHYAVLGTDIATTVLAEARQAIYARAMMDPVPPDKRLRYVMAPKNPARDAVRIVPELRRNVQFQHLNLMDQHYPFDKDVDVIFCRNVLIYFDKPTQKAVVERLASHLRPGGFLLLGHAESMAGSGIAGLRQVRPTVFRAEGRAPHGTVTAIAQPAALSMAGIPGG